MDSGTADPVLVDDGGAASAGVAPPPAPVVVVSSEEVEETASAKPNPFVSLYDSAGTSLAAVVLGIVIVGGVQWIGARSFQGEGGEHRALTRFVTAMVAIMVGVYVSDMLIAGPNAMLLGEGERLAILSFVKDTALMIFAYYFGTKSASTED